MRDFRTLAQLNKEQKMIYNLISKLKANSYKPTATVE